jgi:hypothetical protein
MLDFPNSPTSGQTFSAGGVTWTWNGTVWLQGTPGAILTARQRNRVVNPTTQVSQENGTTAVTTAGSHMADQWMFHPSGIAGSGQRVNPATPSPEGTNYAVAITATTAKASLAAGDYLFAQTPIEGNNVSDMLWGGGSAKQAVLRFCATCDTAGTYGISIRNQAINRSWLGSFTVTTVGVPQVFTVVIPGDTTGTWLKDSGTGMWVAFSYAFGTTLTGVPGWQAGNLLGPSGCTNGAATANAKLYITDVGLYRDNDLTGIAPPFETTSYEDDLFHCKRYWQQIYMMFSGFVNVAGMACHATAMCPVMPRTSPSYSGSVIGQSNFPAAVGSIVGAGVIGGVYEYRISSAAVAGSSFFQTLMTANARLS